ncbi:MAG: hypothetical protein V1644_02830 [Candidatus Micrarchaeota archaeon]
MDEIAVKLMGVPHVVKVEHIRTKPPHERQKFSETFTVHLHDKIPLKRLHELVGNLEFKQPPQEEDVHKSSDYQLRVIGHDWQAIITGLKRDRSRSFRALQIIKAPSDGRPFGVDVVTFVRLLSAPKPKT